MATVSIPEYKHCMAKDIIDWCKENKQVEWLKETNAECKGFFQLRKAFYVKFAPEKMPKKSKQTYIDAINNL